MEFIDIVKKRYAAKSFTGELLAEEKVNELLELIKYSASSFGLQPYKIVIVKDTDMKAKLQGAAYNQIQVGTASHVLVMCAYTDYEKRIAQYDAMIGNKAPEYIQMMKNMLGANDSAAITIWAKHQTYIALANALNGATALGFDSCPMEGFDAKAFSEILALPEELVPTIVVPIGIANDEPKPKIRYSDEELFIHK